MLLKRFSYDKGLINIGALASGTGSGCTGDLDLPSVAGIVTLVPSSFAGALISGIYPFSIDLIIILLDLSSILLPSLLAKLIDSKAIQLKKAINKIYLLR